MQSERRKAFNNYFVLSILLSSSLLIVFVYLFEYFRAGVFWNLFIPSLFMTLILISAYKKKRIPVTNNLTLLGIALCLFPFIRGKIFYISVVLLLMYLNLRFLGYKLSFIKRTIFKFNAKYMINEAIIFVVFMLIFVAIRLKFYV